MIPSHATSLSLLVLTLGLAAPALLAGCSGDEGDSGGDNQGPPGPPGPAGETGPAGAEGPAGPQGELGAEGPAGPQGEAGPAGPAGPQGEAGPAGPAGAQGFIGPQGPQGMQGMQGPAGPAGANGATGAAGPAGATGAMGATGAQGATGLQGPAGPMGPAGTVGPAGAAGSVGPAGPPGPQGPAGPPGSGAYAEDEPGFAGFTVATFNGSLGGRPAAHAACGAEFSGAHLCHASEYLLSRSATNVPAAGAWLDASATETDSSLVLQGSTTYGRNTSYSCQSFTTTSNSFSGTYLQPSGAVTWNSGVCNLVRPLACCNGAPKHVFAGFTAGTYTGNLGGRPAVHAICNAEFSGAHLCDATAYLRSVSATPITTEAWLDASADLDGGLTLQGVPSSGPNTGYSCQSFTTTSNSFSGTYLQTSGAITWNSGVCATPRRIACCH